MVGDQGHENLQPLALDEDVLQVASLRETSKGSDGPLLHLLVC